MENIRQDSSQRNHNPTKRATDANAKLHDSINSDTSSRRPRERLDDVQNLIRFCAGEAFADTDVLG